MADTTITDRERILLAIIWHLSHTQTTLNRSRSSAAFGDHVHFAPWDEPRPGDLVLASCGRFHEYTIGYYVEPLPGPFGGAVIREIGTGNLCDYSNESFKPIRNLPPLVLLEGAERAFYNKVLAAFRSGDEYCYRFGGIKFDGSRVEITIREAFGGMGGRSTPFSFCMDWNQRTSVKAILSAMRLAGYGTRSFELIGTDQSVCSTEPL